MAKRLGVEEFRGLIGARIALREDYVAIVIGTRRVAEGMEAASRLVFGSVPGVILIQAHEVGFSDRRGSAYIHILSIPKRHSSAREWEAGLRALGAGAVREGQDIAIIAEGDKDHFVNAGCTYLEWIRTGDRDLVRVDSASV